MPPTHAGLVLVQCVVAQEPIAYGMGPTRAIAEGAAAKAALGLLVDGYDPTLSANEEPMGAVGQGGPIQDMVSGEAWYSGKEGGRAGSLAEHVLTATMVCVLSALLCPSPCPPRLHRRLGPLLLVAASPVVRPSRTTTTTPSSRRPPSRCPSCAPWTRRSRPATSCRETRGWP